MTHHLLKRLFWITLLLMLATLAALGLIDTGLKTPDTPNGIVSFELCAYGDRCATVLQAWGPRSRDLALLSLGIDYLFMLLYPGVICLGLLLALGYVPDRMKPTTRLFSKLIWVAFVTDAIENFALIQMALAHTSNEWAWPASAAATIKFAAFVSALLWLIFVFFAYSRRARTVN